MLDYVEINHTHQTNACVIWLHGLGADGHDFAPVIEMLDLPHIHFILPHAPYRPITLNNGYQMRGWYDLYGLGIDSRQDQTGIEESQASLYQLIEQVKSHGIPAQRIAIAGFSQGGAIALHSALRYQERLAGVLALSTYLPLSALLAKEKTTANQKTPILMAHGIMDEIIAINTSQRSRDILLAEAYQVQWREYAMAHSVIPEEITEIRNFLLQIFS